MSTSGCDRESLNRVSGEQGQDHLAQVAKFGLRFVPAGVGLAEVHIGRPQRDRLGHAGDCIQGVGRLRGKRNRSLCDQGQGENEVIRGILPATYGVPESFSILNGAPTIVGARRSCNDRAARTQIDEGILGETDAVAAAGQRQQPIGWAERAGPHQMRLRATAAREQFDDGRRIDLIQLKADAVGSVDGRGRHGDGIPEMGVDAGISERAGIAGTALALDDQGLRKAARKDTVGLQGRCIGPWGDQRR